MNLYEMYVFNCILEFGGGYIVVRERERWKFEGFFLFLTVLVGNLELNVWVGVIFCRISIPCEVVCVILSMV